MTAQDLHKFKKLTGIELKLDGDLSALSGQMYIDIFDLDDKLKALHGDYDINGKTMSDFVTEKYGDEANQIIKDNLI